jgi:hypothetical protein
VATKVSSARYWCGGLFVAGGGRLHWSGVQDAGWVHVPDPGETLGFGLWLETMMVTSRMFLNASLR